MASERAGTHDFIQSTAASCKLVLENKEGGARIAVVLGRA